jgi:hypothetical protein
MNIYRAIYEENFGPIPVDDSGRTYDIHHIDGNHKNNDILNLIALPIQEHYNVHLKQGDYSACVLIALRMNMSKEEISKLNKQAAIKRRDEGKCNFGSEYASKVQRKLVEEGRHHMLGDGSFQRKNAKKIIDEGRHNMVEKSTCPNCGKIGQARAMMRWHFDNCREVI